MVQKTRQFLMLPAGRIVAVELIANVGITDTGLIVTGDDGSPLDFRRCSSEEAVAFRDELMNALRAYMNGRPVPRLSWDTTVRPSDQQPKSEDISLRVLPGSTG